MSDPYYSLIIDDDDDDDDDGGALDTQWITALENDILLSEYRLFLKSDITHISFRFIYLDCDKNCVNFVIPMAGGGPYPLQRANQITQSEILQIIQRNQTPTMPINGSGRRKKKYYNFHSLLLYDFQLEDDNVIRSVAEYVMSSGGGGGGDDGVAACDLGRIIEYTNLLSFDTIYFKPLIEMFHELVGFTVLLYED